VKKEKQKQKDKEKDKEKKKEKQKQKEKACRECGETEVEGRKIAKCFQALRSLLRCGRCGKLTPA
jgi:hypothetical protein